MSEQQDLQSRLQQVVASLQAGQPDRAESLLETLASEYPDDPEVRLRRAMLAIQRRHWEEAGKQLQAVLDREPENPGALINQAVVLRAGGRLQEAADACKRVIEQQNEHTPLAWEGLGQCLVATGQWQQAAGAFRQALGGRRDLVLSWSGLGTALSRLGQNFAASQAWKEALSLQPDSPVFRYHYAEALRRQGRALEAIPYYPDSGLDPAAQAEALIGKARAQLAEQLLDGARASLDRARALDSGELREKIDVVEAHLLNALGHSREALVLMRELLHRDKASVGGWSLLCRIDPSVVSDADVAVMQKLLEKAAPAAQANLHFALAGVFRDREDLAREAEHLHKGNELKAAGAPFDPEAWREQNRYFTDGVRRLLEQGQQPLPPADEEELPVFIVGMPRSGTTLLEQILSGHSSMNALGESSLLKQLRVIRRERGLDGDQQLMEYFSAGDLERFRALMDQWLSERLDRPYRFTEKSMLTVSMLGLAALALGNARFVHIQRHPLDVCWGCYQQLFDVGQHFSYSLAGCADMYVLHQELMETWKTLFGERILTVRYEDLVTEPEVTLERITDFCGLSFEDGLLAFREREGAVMTASASQVRRGLFTSAAGRWKQYGELLDPLRRQLESRGVEIPD